MAAWAILKALLVTLVWPFRLPLLSAIDVCTSWMDFANSLLVLLSHLRKEYVQVRCCCSCSAADSLPPTTCTRLQSPCMLATTGSWGRARQSDAPRHIIRAACPCCSRQRLA
jgi:hypothetical protein